MKYIISLFVLLCFAINLSSQDLYKPGQRKSDFLARAEAAFQQGDYYTAYTYFTEAYLFDTSDINITYKTAEAAREFAAYGEAERYYKSMLNKSENTDYPLSAFRLGEMQQKQGKYKEAAVNYKWYLAEHAGENTYYDQRAQMQIAACDWAQTALDNPRPNMAITHLGQNINTPYSEFGGIFSGDEMYYTSLRFKRDIPDEYPEKLRSKILINGESDVPVVMEELNENDRIWAAHTAFGNDGKVMYYTLCDYDSLNNITCAIYYRQKSKDHWGDAIKLPEHINADSSTTTDPAIGFNEKVGKEILYFSSDRPGSKGKKDIWYSIIDENMHFSQPMNLSGINTIEDDISPFYDIKKHTLYFSSEGYRGMGGFDVYKTYLGGNGWDGVIHMGSPLNSSYNDIYFTMNNTGDKGLVASNRLGSYYLDNKPKACCYDLYEVDIQPCDVLLNVFTFDADSKDSLRKVTVSLVDVQRGEEQKFTIYEKDIAKFHFPIECARNYIIRAERDGYLPAVAKLSTPKSARELVINKNLYLQPKSIILKVLVFNKETKNPLRGARVQLIALPAHKVKDTKVNLSGHEFEFNPNVCKSYFVRGDKRGYLPDEIKLEVPCDATGEIVVKLYLDPYLTGILPIVLYFDNDRPNPKTYSKRTKTTYSESFDEYYGRKQEFIDNYVVEGDSNDLAKMDHFFEHEVKGGHDQFQEFLEVLHLELSKGKKFEIFIKGYASPRAGSSYNKILGARRVQAVRNEFHQYSKNKCLQYIRNGQLKIMERSFGEEEAPKNISDKMDDPRNSVFGVEASSQRKVEIVEVKKNGN